MSENYYFKTAVAGSPSYAPSTFVKYFEAFFNQGVRNKAGGALLVAAQGTPAMAVDVAAGFYHGSTGGGGYAGELDTPKSLAIASNSSGSVRIDSIVGELDITNGVALVKVVQGTPGAGAPTLTNDATKRQVELARVTVANGAASITSGNISDVRVASLPQVALTGLAGVLDDPLFYY